MQGGWLDQFYRRVAAAPKAEPETIAAPEAPSDVLKVAERGSVVGSETPSA